MLTFSNSGVIFVPNQISGRRIAFNLCSCEVYDDVLRTYPSKLNAKKNFRKARLMEYTSFD